MPYQILLFSAIFMAAGVIAYVFTPAKYRYISLLAVSLICVCFISGYGTIFLLTTILTTYLSGLVMDNIVSKNNTKGLEKELRKQIKAKVKKKKQLVVLGYIIINMGILLILKYFNFFYLSGAKILNLMGVQTVPLVLKVALPLGISYYTLQALSYVIDVFRGKYKAEKNILKLGLFVSFFPQLHEGPFGRYDLLMPQLSAGNPITACNVYNGSAKILWGLFKIFMVSNRAAIISDAVFGGYEKYGGFTVLLGGAAFTLQLYAEFSGYIDISRGISKILGIDLAKNFDMPFLAQNVAEFWRRWHISLGAFFRDYVFYPVSTSKGLRKLTKKLSFNAGNFITVTTSLLVVWFLTGLWHGANEKYVCYGLYYFILIVAFNILSPWVEKLLSKAKISSDNKILVGFRIVKTVFFVLIGMIMFRAENMNVFFNMIGSLFSSGEAFNLFESLEFKEVIVLILSSLVIVLGALMKICNYDIENKFNQLSSYKKYWICFSLFFIVMIFGAYGLDYLPPDPIYGGF